MRVLLISANTEQLQMPVLPMGLACVASAAEGAGHDVRTLNLMTRDKLGAELEVAINGFHPEVIGISVRNIDDQCMGSPNFLLDTVGDVVRSCRALSSARIVLGGAGYSIYPQSALDWLGGDIGVQGEGESAFLMLLDALANGREDLSVIPRLFLPSRDRIESCQSSFAGTSPVLSTPQKEKTGDLDRFPLPDPHGLLSFPTEFSNQTVWLPFQTRRGCPMDCGYCSTASIEGRALRKRSPELAAKSMAGFAETGFTNFFIVDNTFNFPESYASELCDRIIERKLDIKWRAILYPLGVNEDLANKMARAGCVEVAFGFESGSREILGSMNKRFSPEEVRRTSGILAGCGISRMGFLLLGWPGETMGTVLESLEFADSLGVESVKLTTGIRIYPYTKLAAIAVSEGVVHPDDDLLFPKFYLAKGIEGWIDETVSEWMRKRPNWHR